MGKLKPPIEATRVVSELINKALEDPVGLLDCLSALRLRPVRVGEHGQPEFTLHKQRIHLPARRKVPQMELEQLGQPALLQTVPKRGPVQSNLLRGYRSGASSFGAGGVALDTDLSIDNNGFNLRRTVSQWGRVMQWTDTSLDINSNQLDNVADYALSGLQPGRLYMVYTNGILSETVNSKADGAGELSITNIDLKAAHTIRLEPVPTGTMIIVR